MIKEIYKTIRTILWIIVFVMMSKELIKMVERGITVYEEREMANTAVRLQELEPIIGKCVLDRETGWRNCSQ